MILTLALTAASLIGFFACNKESAANSSTTTGNNIPPELTVTASLQGRVIDENGTPVQGAAVTSGTATTTTDINGAFTFTNISLSSRFGYVKVSKTGYFTGSRSIITNGGEVNYISIRLTPRQAKGTFPAATGGKIAIQSGDSASFPAAAIVNATTNTAYTGTVHVYATYLDPTDSILYRYMPGDLRGTGSDGKETALQSFGMMGVELQDDAGNKLQIASGQKATLTFAIPTSLQASAPATIPLWYFNDSTGRWIQQGTAGRQGNSYIGQVSHFSYWNCDAPVATINFKVNLKDQYGNPLAFTWLQFASAVYGTRGAYTDVNGFAQGVLPKGQEFVLQAMTECGGLLGGINVGPTLSDLSLGSITVSPTNAAELILKGTVANCSNNLVDSGYVNVLVDGLNHRAAVTKGAFMLPINRCYATTVQVKLTAVDLTNQTTGSTVTISALSDTVRTGQLSACN